jgi:methylenetetrahydrofolate dehydrogenase (NADP+)/methenyltetrahydrofolate cyclohydrolase
MAIIINGKQLADEEMATLKLRYASCGRSVTLAILTCDPNLATQSYLALKERTATLLGVEVSVVKLPKEATTETVLHTLTELGESHQGLIVQLPLPAHIDTARVLSAVPRNQDVDVFQYAGESTHILPPVVGAIDLITRTYGVAWSGRSVVVLGAGRLVGAPSVLYAQHKGAEVTVLTEDSTFSESERRDIIKAADIIILGAGKAKLLGPDMVKEGVVVFDAGASEDGGVLVGDADKAVSEVASLFTPVPGGIGPLTIVILFRNLLELALRQ